MSFESKTTSYYYNEIVFTVEYQVNYGTKMIYLTTIKYNGLEFYDILDQALLDMMIDRITIDEKLA